MTLAQHRLDVGDRLIIASHNRGKIPEFQRLLLPLGVTLSSGIDHGLPEPEETGLSFEDNAILKARAAAIVSGIPALADDSGLCVTALGGAPGIYSARWAGATKDFKNAMQRVEIELRDKSDRSACFVCVLALCWPDGTVQTYRGEVSGTIIWPPRGAGGFGYAPIFQPENAQRTFGEMTEEEKHILSHRGRACDLLLQDQIETVALYRPTGPKELAMLQDGGFRRWPPRRAEQPIFYPVTSDEYAIQIAREWNVPASGAGYVTRFYVRKSFMDRYPTHQVGGARYTEWWIPADELESLNDNIIGQIEVIHAFASVHEDAVSSISQAR